MDSTLIDGQHSFLQLCVSPVLQSSMRMHGVWVYREYIVRGVYEATSDLVLRDVLLRSTRAPADLRLFGAIV